MIHQVSTVRIPAQQTIYLFTDSTNNYYIRHFTVTPGVGSSMVDYNGNPVTGNFTPAIVNELDRHVIVDNYGQNAYNDNLGNIYQRMLDISEG